MDPNAQYVSFIVTSKAGHNSQPGLPKSFLLDVSSDSGEAALDSPAGKALLIEAKRKALTEEVFVEQSMLKCPETFEKLMELVEKAPASLFRLVNVDQSWIDSMGHNVTTAEHMQKLFDVFRERDVTFKVKVIFCLKKLWETRVFENFLSHILERTSTDVRAVMDLYHMAVILSFEVPNLTTAPADIFPYGSTAQHWVESTHGAHVEASVRSIICSYYIRIIHNIFSMNNVSNLHHIKPILSKYNVTHQARVCEVEGGMCRLVDEIIFPMLGHARTPACALAVFLAVQMLSTKNPRLESFVRSHDFVTPLQEASRSIVYSHTKWAVSHLMKLMLSPPNLVDHTLPCFAHWYDDACAAGQFDVRNIRFRFPYEFAHTVLREGMERGPPGTKGGDQWASPIRHSFALRCVIEAILDKFAPQRQLRSLTVLKLMLAPKWTTRKELQMLVTSPKFDLMPAKVHCHPLGSDSSDDATEDVKETRSKSGSAMKATLKRAPSFFRKKHDSHKTLSRKALTASVDQQQSSGLMHMPEKVLLRIFLFLSIEDLLTCCALCWKMVAFVDGPSNGLWQHAYERDHMYSMHATLDDKHSKKPDEALLQWKQQCKVLARGQLPYALYRVVQWRSAPVQHGHEDTALHIDAAQAVNNEIVVTALKMAGTLQRTPMWWPDMEPFVESHWAELLLSVAHSDSLEVSKAAWRMWYQLLAYHPGMVDRFIEKGLLERFLKPLDLRAKHVVIFNGLYYLTKLLSNEAATAEHRKRMARKDVQTLAQWIKDSNIWPQWHTIYNAFQSDPRGHSFIFPALASLFSAVHDSFLCKKLKTSLCKVPDYRLAISTVRDLSHGKTVSKDQGEEHAAPRHKEGLSHDGVEDSLASPSSSSRSGGAARNTGRISEKRGVTASGVKVFRDCGRHGARPIDIEDGVALIRRNSDPGPPVAATPNVTANGVDNKKRRVSSSQ